jgi:hypothetical protein
MLGMLNETDTVTEVKKQWDDASNFLFASKHREHDGKYVLGKAVPNWMGSLTGWPIVFASLLAGTVMPGAAVLVQLALARKRAAYKAAVETASTAGKVITANSPEPTFNIIQSEGTAILRGTEAAMVAGQVTVLMAQKAPPPPPVSTTTFLGGIAEKFMELKGKVTALFTPGADVLTAVTGMLATAVPNEGTVAVIGEVQTLIASPNLVEVTGLEKVKITSTKHVDVLGEEKVDMLAGPRAKPPWGVKVDATAKKVTMGHVIGDWKTEITDRTAKIGDLKMSRGMQSEKAATKLVHGTSTSLELTTSAANLKASSNIDVKAPMIKISGQRVMIG